MMRVWVKPFGVVVDLPWEVEEEQKRSQCYYKHHELDILLTSMHFPCPLHGPRSEQGVSKNDAQECVMASIGEDTFPLGLWHRRL